MSDIKENLLYTKTHEWVLAKDDGSYDFGITDNAQQQLGDMVYVELPEVGDHIESGDSFCTVESVKAASDVYAPTNLKVVAINANLEASPELINTSPYEDGYLLSFSADNVDGLLNAEEYQEFLAEGN